MSEPEVYDRETDELVKLKVTDKRVAVITGVSYAVVATGSRPSSWTPAETSGSDVYARITGFPVGSYHVWVQVVTSDETAVLDAGAIKIT